MLPDKSPDARSATSERLLNGRYELAEKVGQGSFFTVYRGRDTQSGRAVAIKILDDHYAPDREFTDRLRSEALAAVQLDHPHIVSVYEAWSEGGRIAIATEFVRGIDLKERVRRVAPFPLAVAIDIAAAVSEALAYAATLGISHGDLRPENILVTPEGEVKLADFGVGAAVCASSRLQMSALLQSAHYLPPEVAQGKPPSAPSDVYSLGVILYEMLSGQPPFQADTPFAIAVKHLHDAPPSLRRQNPGVPKAVEGIVQKCLLKDPTARYPNPSALLADLRGVREALRYGKPLAWTPTPEPGAVASGRNAAAVGKGSAPAPPQTAARVPALAVAPEPAAGEPSMRLLVLLPLMAIALAAAVFAVFVVGTRAPKDTVVPNVVGMTRDDAQRRLTEAGLRMRVVRERYDDRVPAGMVQFTNPPLDSQVKQGRVVELWISKGPEPAVVPNVVGLGENEARARLREARVIPGAIRREYDEVAPKGTLISQEPAAGTEVARQAEVSLVVSKGPEPEPPPEPATAPEPAPTSAPDSNTTTDGTSTGTSTGGAPTDGGLTGGIDAGSGTTTDFSSPEGSPNPAAPAAATNPERVFDISTKIAGDRPQSRLRIVVTDDRGRRQVLNELYARGQTVRKSIKATGAPGKVRIEVYENRELVKDEQH